MFHPRLLRSSSTAPCTCYVCIVSTCEGRNALKLKKKPGRPRTEETPTNRTIQICAHCFASIQRGHSQSKYDCSSRRIKVLNVENIISSPNPEQRFE